MLLLNVLPQGNQLSGATLVFDSSLSVLILVGWSWVGITLRIATFHHDYFKNDGQGILQGVGSSPIGDWQ